MGIFDVLKKFAVESDSKLINNSLFKSNTDLLFDELYRIIKKYSNSNEQTFFINQNENCISYSIDSIDMIHICTANEDTLETTVYYIFRQKSDYLLKIEKYKFNKNLKDKELISENNTLNIQEIEYVLSDSVNFLKVFFEEKIKCDNIFFIMYNSILEEGENSKEDANIKVVKVSNNYTHFSFKVSTSEKNIIEICIITPEDITIFAIINKLTYYTCIEYEMISNSNGKLEVKNESQGSNIKETFNCLKEFEEIIEETYTSVKRNKTTNKINFYQFNEAKEINIPYRIKRIEDNTFIYCDLEKIEIADSVEYIGDLAFCSCQYLKEVKLSQSIKSLNKKTFYECKNLLKIEIPNSVTSIGEFAFCGCSSLKEIEIPNSVTSIGKCAFTDCRSLEKIEIPNSVTFIGECAFSNCISLKEIEIPNSVTSIGESAFAGCSNLKEIEIPNSVTSIGENAFCNCHSLQKIKIPNSVTSIGEWAFGNCRNLKEIEIPNSVTSIGENAFSRCERSLCIYCNKGSYVEKYAETNEINFKYII